MMNYLFNGTLLGRGLLEHKTTWPTRNMPKSPKSDTGHLPHKSTGKKFQNN